MNPRPLPGPLARIPCLYRGRGGSTPAQAVLPSGQARLDRLLPGGGWPRAALSELLGDGPPGQGLGLLLPALARLAADGRWVALLDPPWIPYPPALRAAGLSLQRVLVVHSGSRDAHGAFQWCAEQLLRGLGDGALLAWPRGRLDFARLRRLQLAAAEGGPAAFLLRPANAANEPSAAVLRLRTETRPGALRLTVLKCRGSAPGACLSLPHGPRPAVALPRPASPAPLEHAHERPVAGAGLSAFHA